MQDSRSRCLILMAVLVAGWGLLMATQRVQAAEARWPVANDLYAIDGWTMSPLGVDTPFADVKIVTRQYIQRGGNTVFVSLKTDTAAKNIYRTGAEVSFQGAGYKVEPAPAELVPAVPGREALVAASDAGRWLILYGYGERRGLLGNGGPAWAWATLDSVLGHPNDYYLLSVQARLDSPANVEAAVALADILFPRVAVWYAD